MHQMRAAVSFRSLSRTRQSLKCLALIYALQQVCGSSEVVVILIYKWPPEPIGKLRMNDAMALPGARL